MGKLLYTAALLIINFEIIDHQEQLHRVQYEADMRIHMVNEKLRNKEESGRRQQEFLRYVLHEIRVPLNALVLGLEGLKTSVDGTAAGAVQQTRDSPVPTAYRTHVPSARVQEEDEQEEEEHDDEPGEAQGFVRGSSTSETLLLPSSPLPSPTLDRSPLLFSNSSLLPSTTSLSRASSPALSTASSASSPGRPSPTAAGTSFSSSTACPAITLCEEDADSINEMWHAVSHMTRLLDDVLSLQRIEDGELLLERRSFSLQDTCVSAVRMMTTWLDNKGMTVQCDVDSTLPLVTSDEYRVRQVLINFLSNAIRFTPSKAEDGSEGRIVLTVKRCEKFDDSEPIIQEGQSEGMQGHEDDLSREGEPQQEQHAQPDDNDTHSSEPSHCHSLHHSPNSLSVNLVSPPATFPPQPPTAPFSSLPPPPSPSRLFIRVAVHDTGIGIPLSDLQRMFTPFVQISSGEAEKGKGTGLGLSICRKLIDLLGGRVGVISAPGKGSTFFFEAPFEVSADQTPSVPLSADQPAALDAINADEASSRTIRKPLAVDSELKLDSLQLITSTLRSKRRAMHSKQRSSSDINSIPLHPANPTSLAHAANSQHTISAPSSPARMVARALTVPPALPNSTRSPPVTPTSVGAPVVVSTAATSPPVFAAAVAAPTAAKSSSRPVRAPTKRPLRVLVVDDADSNRKLLARLVSKDGAAVCEQARDGQEAVNMVQGDVARFDVILCDKEMPVMDGYGAVREMRRLGVVCPIIGVTANALVNDQAEFIACGLDALVTKPVNMGLLNAAIHETLQQRAGARGSIEDEAHKEQHPLPISVKTE